MPGLIPRSAWRTVFALVITAHGCLAQGRVNEFLGVQNWNGTITITGSGSGSTSGGPYSDVWKYSITSNATIQLPTVASNIQGWTGTFAGSAAIDASDVSTSGGCSQTSTQTFQGALGVGKAFTMHLVNANQYVFYPSDYLAQGGTNSTSNSCAPGTLGGPAPVTWSPVTGTSAGMFHDLPATGFSLKGSEILTMNSPMQPNSALFGGTPAVINVTVTWDFEAGSTGPAPAITSNGILNGASFLPQIASNSWTTIQGTNLASQTDDWSKSLGGGTLPVSLDCVSVTMGGKPAYIYYISPTQLNVLAPNLDPGPVSVIVTTCSGSTSPTMVVADSYAPALFLWPGNQPVATRADYTYAVKADTFPGLTTIPAKPGDVIVLWATGCGPTSPATPAGVPVPGDQIYATASTPVVTIDNVPAVVYGGALTPGSAGLYQIAIQVPNTLADGDWPIQVSIGGASSPAGAVLTVHH